MGRNKINGFTLLELLVVIAIIGVLATIVMGSLSSSRSKAKDAAIIQGIREFEKLMQLEYNDTGSYSNLQSCVWAPIAASNCDSMFSGAHAVEARNMCNNILSNSKPLWGNPGYGVYICNAVDNSQKYSIMASLNNGYWFCSGSSGISSKAYYWASSLDGADVGAIPSRWSETPIGCEYNP
jgi:prepilin-type N-terminal cleavage/methylation domain-containing protein